MGVVTVGAGHARALHPALDERAPLVDLSEDLTVRVVEMGLEQRRDVGVEKGLAIGMGVDDRTPPRMTAGTDLHLGRGPGRPRPLGDTALAVLDGPRAVAPPEVHDEAGCARRRPRCPGGARLGPGDVGRGGTVAFLAGHRELRPGSGVAVRGEVVSLPEVRRVALGALEVPRLLPARPVKRVRRPERLVGIEVKPALTALGPGPRVPGQAQRLEPTARERDEVLLEGIDAEGIGDLELTGLAVRPVGANEELAVAAEERRGDAPVSDSRLVEAAEDRLIRGGLDRARVVGAPVGLRLPGVAAGALRAADEGRRRGGSDRRVLGRLVGSLAAGREDQAGERRRQDREADELTEGARSPASPDASGGRARPARRSRADRSAGSRRHHSVGPHTLTRLYHARHSPGRPGRAPPVAEGPPSPARPAGGALSSS